MKKSLLPKCSSSRYFYQALWRFFKFSAKPIFAGGFVAPPWRGEMRSNYLQNTPHFRKRQIHRPSAAFGGGQIVRFWGQKDQLAILSKREFFITP